MKSFAPLALAVALFAVPAFAQDAVPADKVWRHGISLIEELKYPEGFTRFDYVNPDAPKGGTFRMPALTASTFDTLNPYPDKGVKGPVGGVVYESLLTSSLDETSADYGLLAEALSYPDDYSSVTYRLYADARWEDGQPVTPEDVVWSFDKLRETNTFYRTSYYTKVEKAEVTGEREVTFTFTEKNNKELPMIVGQFSILPKHWWEGKDASGKQRDITAPSLETPMGSGPYRISAINPGNSITFERRPDYWGKDTPVNVGSNNFDRITYEYFRDPDVAFEAFKGDQFDVWSENRAKRWAQSYDFPAVTDGRVIRDRIAGPLDDTGVMVGFFYNLRKAKFQDVRVRRALNYAFDFEQLQKTIFFGEYTRISSFFFRTDLASTGLPEGKELDILNGIKDLVPPEVFTQPYTNPVSGDQAKLRENLREAARLLDEAGYTVSGTTRMTPDGQPFTVEILLQGPTIEPVAENLVTNLGRIGIQVTIRSVDDAQFEEREKNFDFDMMYEQALQTLSPGNEQRGMWGSAAADEPSSRNFAGLKDPAVDKLVEMIPLAADRETLIATTKALDRVLLAKQIIIPSYTAVDVRLAYWDRFGHPEKLPRFAVGYPTIWWWDEAKAAKTGGN